MKIMKIGYVLLIGIAAFIALPTHGADSDSAALRKCIDIDDEMTIHYNCEEPATVAFCYEDIVMKQNATDTEIRLAEDMHCRSRDGFHDPCLFYGAGKCGNIELQAWARRIGGYTVVYGVCPRAGNQPRWVSNPGSNGRYTCDPDPMEGIRSDDSGDGGAEMLSEDDLYERYFGDYESSLSALLDGDLSSAEILGRLLVELLGGELSFEDALGNIGKGQKDSGDQGSKQSNLSASSAACKEFLDALVNVSEMAFLYYDQDLQKVPYRDNHHTDEEKLLAALYAAAQSVGIDGSKGRSAVVAATDIHLDALNEEYQRRGYTVPSIEWQRQLFEKVTMPTVLKHIRVCGY